MRRLLPDPDDEALEGLYQDLVFPDPPDDRPYVYLDMVTSVDGAASVDGHTRDLGGEADRVAFRRLREWCEVILVGAGTARIENYGPPRFSEASQSRRQGRGLGRAPRLAVVTASAALDPDSRFFSVPEQPSERPDPVVFVIEDADPDRLSALDQVAELVVAGRHRVDLARALAHLRQSGARFVCCEGGPTLNAGLFDADLVDELFVTVSPELVGASGHRILERSFSGAPRRLELVELREHDSELLARYRVRPRGGGR